MLRSFLSVLLCLLCWTSVYTETIACMNGWRTRKIRELYMKRNRKTLERVLLVQKKQKKLRKEFRHDPARKTFRLIHDMITGRFARLSKHFHRWRIRDRRRKLKRRPNVPGWYDDIAVSYDKLGKYNRAIRTIKRKYRFKTNRYETLANHGTFYIHKAIFKNKKRYLPLGLKKLKEAVKLNANAHFGREIYQILLVEHVGRESRLSSRRRWAENRSASKDGFAGYVMAQKHARRTFVAQQYFPALSKRPRALRDAAVRGVLGMMRFGHHDSPILLSALGSLLSESYGAQGKRTAARAYLKASYEAKKYLQKRFYRKQAQTLLLGRLQQEALSPDQATRFRVFEGVFREDLNRARRWSRLVEKKQRRWLRKAKDPEEKFFQTYFANTKTTTGRLLLLTDRAFSRQLQRALPASPRRRLSSALVGARLPLKKAPSTTLPKAAKHIKKAEVSNSVWLFVGCMLFLAALVLFSLLIQARQRRQWEELVLEA